MLSVSLCVRTSVYLSRLHYVGSDLVGIHIVCDFSFFVPNFSTDKPLNTKLFVRQICYLSHCPEGQWNV